MEMATEYITSNSLGLFFCTRGEGISETESLRESILRYRELAEKMRREDNFDEADKADRLADALASLAKAAVVKSSFHSN